MSNEPQDETGALGPRRLVLTLGAMLVVLGGLAYVWRSKSAPSTCADRGELVHRRSITMLVDGSKSMEVHAAVAEEAMREVVKTIAPGDVFAASQISGSFDEDRSRLLRLADVPPVRADLTAPDSTTVLSSACRGELDRQWAQVAAKRAEWLGRVKLDQEVRRECSAYFTALEALGRAGGMNRALDERWLMVIGDMEAETTGPNGRCLPARPDRRGDPKTKVFEGVRVVLAVPQRDGPNGRFWRDDGAAWKRYFQDRGAREVQAISLQDFRAGGASRLLGSSAPPPVSEGVIAAARP